MTLSSFNINEKYHSGFYSRHSTETVLFKIINDVKSNTDQNKDSVLVLLNCSIRPLHSFKQTSQFDCPLFNDFNIANKEIFVKSFPQGSISGPTLFQFHILPLRNVIRRALILVVMVMTPSLHGYRGLMV